MTVCAFLLRNYFSEQRAAVSSYGEPDRIISLSPGITETLFALGLGKKIVGVTEFCNWPPEAAKKTRVAGFREINLEAMVKVKPDLAILPGDMSHFSGQIERLGIPVFLFEGRSLSGYLRSVKKLAEVCRAICAGESLARKFNTIADGVKNSKNAHRPSILFAILNAEDCVKPITELSVIGSDGFYNELIKYAGGKNVYTGKLPYPKLSGEAIVALNPDIIIATAPQCENFDVMIKSWRKLGKLGAVEHNRLKILTNPGHSIPGPRSFDTLKEISDLVKNYHETCGKKI